MQAVNLSKASFRRTRSCPQLSELSWTRPEDDGAATGQLSSTGTSPGEPGGDWPAMLNESGRPEDDLWKLCHRTTGILKTKVNSILKHALKSYQFLSSTVSFHSTTGRPDHVYAQKTSSERSLRNELEIFVRIAVQ